MTIPILVIAYNRPNTLLAQLKRLDFLPSRQVQLSIDGPKSSVENTVESTRQIALAWQKQTSHEVEIISRVYNHGIYDHLPLALQDFFAKYAYGLILEDDIEFIPEYVTYLDKNLQLFERNEYWSICGHNPRHTLNPYNSKEVQVQFRRSDFHSIWGWATHKSAAMCFANEYSTKLDFGEVSKVLKNVSKRITNDPLLRMAFIATWMRKLKGWEQRRIASGWDTRWVYQAWKEDRPSLIPNVSLSRETLDQSEGQTHRHSTYGLDWKATSKSQFTFRIDHVHKKSEIELLRVWGITRKYSWLYFPRIYKEIRNLVR